jgi:putative SOS response-associated peptidase YedK
MCGRYNIIDDPSTQALMKVLGITRNLTTQYNIAPTDTVPVILGSRDDRELVSMRWWLIPAWTPEPSTRYSMFNARAESITESSAFRTPFKRQRCILPASSFIEWHTENGQKQPYEIRQQASAIGFAGIWDRWGQGDAIIHSCCIITTNAIPQFQHIHNRMPVMLPPDVFERWLDPRLDGKQLLPLLMAGLPRPTEVRPVDPRINNSRIKEAPCATGPAQLLCP